MRHILALLLSQLSFITPALALDAQACRSDFEALMALIGVQSYSYLSEPSYSFEQACLIEGVYLHESYNRLYIDKVQWGIESKGRLADGDLPSLAVVELTGFASAPDFNNPVRNYLYALQNHQPALDVFVSYRWMKEAGEARLHFASEHPDGSTIEAQARLFAEDLTTLDAAVSNAGALVLHDLMLQMRLNTLFEDKLAFPLGIMLLNDQSPPEEQVTAHKRRAETAIMALPAAIFDQETKQALSALIADLPHPKGRLEMRAYAPEGISGAQIIAAHMRGDLSTPQGFLDFLSGKLSITAAWER